MNILTAEYVKIELVKRAVGNPDLIWRNTYEAHLMIPGAPPEVYQQTLLDLCNAEKALHTSNVEYIRAIISTYAQEGTVYDPSSFIVKEIGAGTIMGTRTISGDVMGAEVVLSVKKTVMTGHSGRIFFRGCLSEGDITTSNSLRSALVSGSKTSLDTALATFLTTFTAEMVALGGADSYMAMLGGYNIISMGPQTDREVLALEARGPSTRQINNAYYDVGP